MKTTKTNKMINKKDIIEVYEVKKGDPLLGGFSTGYANYKKGYIAINKDLSAKAKKETIYHELAHFKLRTIYPYKNLFDKKVYEEIKNTKTYKNYKRKYPDTKLQEEIVADAHAFIKSEGINGKNARAIIGWIKEDIPKYSSNKIINWIRLVENNPLSFTIIKQKSYSRNLKSQNRFNTKRVIKKVNRNMRIKTKNNKLNIPFGLQIK